MSAIAGVIGPLADEESRSCVERMCRIQRHRGPHGTTIKAYPGAAIGVCSLSLPPADAPFGDSAEIKGVAAIVFDGQLFNRATLARNLEGDGFESTVSTEAMLALRSYLRWGERCAEHLDGIFGFAVWDQRIGTVYAARDRFGEKPLFYATGRAGALLFASEIKAIIASGRIAPELDHEAIYHFLFQKGFNPPRTPLRAVHWLLPGHWLRLRNGKFEMGRYWDFPCFEEKIDDERIVLETAKELLTEAVRERLRSPSSLGLLFSGGTDSSLLLGIIARISNKRIKTYTIIEGLREEQRNMASALALAFGTDHTEIHLTPERVAKTIKEIVWHASLPTVGSLMEHVGATEAYSQGVSVLFSGHMADSVFQAPSLLRYTMPLELMLSPARLLPDAIRTRIYDFGEKILRPVFTGHSAIIPRRFLYPTYLYFRRKRGLFRRYNTGIFPKDARALFHSSIDRSRWRSPADSCRAIYRECPSGRLDERLTYTVVKLFASVNATIHESIGAAQSVQIQAPFLDQQLFEFAQRIPFSLKGKGGNEKYIIRELCRIFVSEQCSIQRKAAFTPPFETWLRKDLWHFVEDVLSRESIERRGVFDHQAVAALCARFKEGRSIIGWADIWALVVIEIWLRLHCDSHLSNSEQSSGRIA